MADNEKFYAWSNFEVLDEKEPGNPRKMTRIVPGDEVTASKLGMEEDEFQAAVDAGAIRNYEHPDMGTFQGSPVEFRKAQLAAAAEGGYYDSQYGTVTTDQVAEIDASTGKSVEPGTNKGPTTTPEADQSK